jgi:hypothetical protein
MINSINSQALRIQKHRVIFPVLLFALIIGILYTVIVPPWQHYDEPTHFEFAWLIANRGNFPGRGEFDQIIRREIAASMLEYDFFDKMDFRPLLIAQGEPVWIGASQINQRSIYYLLIAGALYLVRGADVVFQLYVGRFFSLGLFLITLIAAYGVVSEVTRPGNPLRWFVPATIALIPGFVDLMTAVNDDVGATALFSLFLWVGVRMIVRGFTVLRLLTIAALTLACYWTKNTITIVVLLAPIPILFGLFRGRKRWIAWSLFAGAGVFVGASLLSWGDAANWYRVKYPDHPVRVAETNTPNGKYAFYFPLTPGSASPSLTQVLTGYQIEQLKGKTVTLGAWIWSSEPVSVRTPILYYDSESVFTHVEVNEIPYYYHFSTKVPDNPTRLQVMLAPVRGQIEKPLSVYYDGLILMEGELVGEPDIEEVRGNQFWIDGDPVTNHLRNGSAEEPWPFVHVWADELITNFFPGRSSLILSASLDWLPSLWYYKATFRQLFTSFWARFGWGNVPLIGFRPYLFLGILTFAGLIGGIIHLGKRGHTLLWDVVIFFGSTLAVVWGAAIMRGIGSILSGPVFIPSARYAYPVIIPSIFLMTIGWNEILKYAAHPFSLSKKWQYTIYFLFFVVLFFLSMISIINFYYR